MGILSKSFQIEIPKSIDAIQESLEKALDGRSTGVAGNRGAIVN